jgi:hypothetical protein
LGPAQIHRPDIGINFQCVLVANWQYLSLLFLKKRLKEYIEERSLQGFELRFIFLALKEATNPYPQAIKTYEQEFLKEMDQTFNLIVKDD